MMLVCIYIFVCVETRVSEKEVIIGRRRSSSSRRRRQQKRLVVHNCYTHIDILLCHLFSSCFVSVLSLADNVYTISSSSRRRCETKTSCRVICIEKRERERAKEKGERNSFSFLSTCCYPSFFVDMLVVRTLYEAVFFFFCLRMLVCNIEM